MLIRISYKPHSHYLQKSLVLMTIFAFLTIGAVQLYSPSSHPDIQKEFSSKITSQPAAALLQIYSKERVKVQLSAGIVFVITDQLHQIINEDSHRSFYHYLPSFTDIHRYARFSRSTFS